MFSDRIEIYKRPGIYSNEDVLVYIAKNTNPRKSGKWFRSGPIGINKMEEFIKVMAFGADSYETANRNCVLYVCLLELGLAYASIMDRLIGHNSLIWENGTYYITICKMPTHGQREYYSIYRSNWPWFINKTQIIIVKGTIGN